MALSTSLNERPTNRSHIAIISNRPSISDAASNFAGITFSDVTSAMVTITVADGEAFCIHEGVLKRISKYFRAAFEQDFLEAKERMIKLPHVSADTFRRFMVWVYTSKIEVGQDQSPGHATQKWKGLGFEQHERVVNQLLQLYILGDAHEGPALRRATFDLLYTIFTEISTYLSDLSIIAIAYKNFSRKSPLLRFFVDSIAKFEWFEAKDLTDTGIADDIQETLPAEFLVDMYIRHAHVAILIRKGLREPNYGLDRCDYHEHAN
ncbi:hypothetical protein BDV96DRAFT_643992 [Lophiotrema nucula]|uniref:BTB domain-containing protein n=1 Tax=Lophiotrema nucula TaxID=690887 RepID=A0A6A5ZGZ5_9PLEO|nr:hypothetical protein BDV96DRAFT_643992 [Lophiotrema nucula]